MNEDPLHFVALPGISKNHQPAYFTRFESNLRRLINRRRETLQLKGSCL
jgi:hypothetical protein